MTSLTWYSSETDEPLDEQADLMGGYWALIGPDGEGRFDWTVVDREGEDVTRGREDNADEAKAAVLAWFRQAVDYSTGRTATPPAGWDGPAPDRDETGRRERAEELAEHEVSGEWAAWARGGKLPERDSD